MAKSGGGVRYSHAKPSEDFKAFRAYGRDWEKTYFNHETGGFVVTDRERISEARKSKKEWDKFLVEQEIAHELADMGIRVEHLREHNRADGKTFDARMDGIDTDFKNVTSVGNIQKRAQEARDQGAKIALLRLDKRKPGQDKALRDAKRHSRRRVIYYYKGENELHEVPNPKK